jgi:hypothetical protein
MPKDRDTGLDVMRCARALGYCYQALIGTPVVFAEQTRFQVRQKEPEGQPVDPWFDEFAQGDDADYTIALVQDFASRITHELVDHPWDVEGPIRHKMWADGVTRDVRSLFQACMLLRQDPKRETCSLESVRVAIDSASLIATGRGFEDLWRERATPAAIPIERPMPEPGKGAACMPEFRR